MKNTPIKLTCEWEAGVCYTNYPRGDSMSRIAGSYKHSRRSDKVVGEYYPDPQDHTLVLSRTFNGCRHLDGNSKAIGEAKAWVETRTLNCTVFELDCWVDKRPQ